MAAEPPYAPTPEDRARARWLREFTGAAEVAWLVDGDRLLVAAGDVPGPHAPTSPVIDLVQAIPARFPDHAHELLRRRIFSTAPLRPVDRAFVKVQAKKASEVPLENGSAASSARTPDAELVDLTATAAQVRAEVVAWHAERAPSIDGDSPMEVAAAWAARADRRGALHERDRPVGAVLVLPDGSITGGAANLGGSNRSLHAEVNLAQMWWAREGRPLPAESRVHVTLQSCRMCAAMLVAACAEPETLRVIYRDEDPGRFARGTALEELGLESRAEDLH